MSQQSSQPLPTTIKLTTVQKSLLGLLYRYRFATSTLLADARGVKISATNQSLKELASLGFIGRRYESSYKLLGKAARYYVAKKGLVYLSQDARYDPKILHAYYRSARLGENFVETTIQTMAVALQLAHLHPGEYRISTKPELVDVPHFRLTSPDLYMRRIKPIANRPVDFLVYVYLSINFVAVQAKLQAILRDMSDGHWESGYPSLMFVVADTAQEHRLTTIITKYLQGKRSRPELAIYTTTVERLHSPKTTRHDLWNPLPPR